jgi:hypothetical protein
MCQSLVADVAEGLPFSELNYDLVGKAWRLRMALIF